MNFLNFMNYNSGIKELRLRNSLSDDLKISHNYFKDQCIKKNIDLNLTGAAVLIPFTIRSNFIDILLTKRSAALDDHAGQVSFPGGRIDDKDSNPIETAKRESFEEVGIKNKDIEVIGSLDVFQTGTGFRIIPIIGIVSENIDYQINQNEVESIFHLPLDYLMDKSNHKKEIKTFQQNENIMEYNSNVIEYGSNHIWGATAAMLMKVYKLLI